MSITSVHKDYDNLTFTLIADFDAPIDRVWELWSDRRKLERWWGPPSHPATFQKHDLTPGGELIFFMTGPDGDTTWGMCQVTVVDPPTSLEFIDAFADSNGRPIPDMPSSKIKVQLIEREGGTRMKMHSTFESRDDMERWVSIGTVEGLQEAVGQMDAVLG
jgi:uncharacterized protein YndB with AHSA1/START domain